MISNTISAVATQPTARPIANFIETSSGLLMAPGSRAELCRGVARPHLAVAGVPSRSARAPAAAVLLARAGPGPAGSLGNVDAAVAGGAPGRTADGVGRGAQRGARPRVGSAVQAHRRRGVARKRARSRVRRVVLAIQPLAGVAARADGSRETRRIAGHLARAGLVLGGRGAGHRPGVAAVGVEGAGLLGR